MNRTLNVVRLQLINRNIFIWLPLIILAGSFLLTLAIFALLQTSGIGQVKYGSGGAQAPLWYFASAGALALAYTFPFSQALSVTRREYFFGTMLTALMTSTGLGIVFIIGGLIERATDGWGMQGYFFSVFWISDQGFVVAGLIYLAIAMLAFTIGFTGAVIFKRFGTIALVSSILGVALLLIGGLWLIGALQAWPQIGAFFGSLQPIGLAGILALIAIALGTISFALLRRATP